MRWLLASIFLAQPALAASSQGHAALALGVLVGSRSPGLGDTARDRLDLLLADQAAPGPAIEVAAKSVVCRAGDVDIAAFACALDFGTSKAGLSGRKAHELFATLAENGAQPDGAAGTIYVAVHDLQCRLEPDVIAQKAGGGAECSFAPGPA